MNFFANLLKLILIVAIIGGIGYGCYALFFKPVSNTNVLTEYETIFASESSQVVNLNINLDETNEFNKYSKNLDSIYDEVVLLYNYEWQILSTMLPEACFGKQSRVMNDISNLLSSYQIALDKTADAIKVYNTDKISFGETPTPEQANNLSLEFKYIANCLLDQTKVLADINAKLVPYMKGEVYGGDNIAKFNTKYLYIEALNMQGRTLLNVLNSEQGVVGTTFFGECQKLYSTYYASKLDNFYRTNTVLTDKFVKAYDKIDKTAFFYALDKSKYYNEIVDVEQKVLIETVMTYFGFVINTVGGE